ncbi:restriction endonuclease subunit S [Acetobacter ghanensis]|uniref:restriction endonuclease subunit S n=1 Tax=Acetobacter ghanensis TaxID=431306 RepID=UPI003D348099
MLPDGWSFKNINEIGIQVIDGDRGKNYPKDNEFQSTGSCLFLSAKNVTKAGFDFSLGQFITNEKHKLLNKGEVKVGDIVITTRGSIGHFAYYNHKKYQSMRINSGMAILRSNVNYTYPDFLYEVCRSQIVKTQIEKASFGSAQPQLTIAIIKKFRIPLPPIPEQKKIAAILSTWDRAIEGTEKLLANNQQQKKALMQQLLTGKKRLPGFMGEWKIGTISEIAHIDTGFAFKSSEFTDNADGMPVVRMSDLKDGILNLESCKRLNLNSLSGLTKFSLKENDFIFGMSGSLSNFAWVKNNNLPCYLNQRVGRIRSKTIGDQQFISYLYLSEKIQKEIEDKAAGAAQLNISLNDIRGMKIKIPPLPEQEAIAAVLTTADKEITAIETGLSRLRQEKKALMQQLLTGKRRVKVD